MSGTVEQRVVALIIETISADLTWSGEEPPLCEYSVEAAVPLIVEAVSAPLQATIDAQAKRIAELEAVLLRPGQFPQQVVAHAGEVITVGKVCLSVSVKSVKSVKR